ncbi:hypothetical protein CLOP_g17329 [Closterium sp. NIES-67]|nr:hypothetical protein CLOP_g17329 [Closterium sp. NIES-67]
MAVKAREPRGTRLMRLCVAVLFIATSTGSTIDLALEAKSTSGAASGWFSVAWTNGGMFNSDAVIGNIATGTSVGTYAISSYSSVVTTSRFAITAASVTRSGGSTIAKFTRSTGDGTVAVNVAGSNKLVWAFSSGGSKTVANHGGSHSVLLHWKKVSATQLDMAVELKTSSGASNGWFALGWANGGSMAPSDAVIGNRAGGIVSPYRITGYTMNSLQGASFSIGSGAGTVKSATGSTTVIQFSRTTGTGSIPIKMSGVSHLIWAHSNSNSKTLAFHSGADGRMSVDFSCAMSPSSVDDGGYDHDGDDHHGGDDHYGDGDDWQRGGGSGSGSSGAFLSQLISWLGLLFGFRK